MQGIKKL